MLSAYREAVDDDALGAELAAALGAVQGAGAYEINGRHYKRVPRGYDPDHPRADLLRFNTLYASSPGIEPSLLSAPNLVDVVMDHCQNMAPIQRWLVRVRGELDA
jgi:uncharacterized protein (DUF2461 family)